MAKLEFLPVLKQVFGTHPESASVMQYACAAAFNLAANGETGGIVLEKSGDGLSE